MQQRKTYTWLWLATVPCVIFKSFKLYKSRMFKLSSMKSLQQQQTPSIADSLCTLVGVYFSQTSMIFAADFALGSPVWQVVHKAVHGSWLYPCAKNLWSFWFCWNFNFLLILGLWAMHLKPAMFLKLGSFLPRFVFNNKCLEFAYFKVEVVS